MKNIKSDLFRIDQSKNYLLQFKTNGYSQVVFINNFTADPQCKNLNGNIYNIEELIKLDNPLFRISHPNCLCKFQPYGQKTNKVPTLTQTPVIPTQNKPMVTVPIVPSQNNI